MSVTRASSRDPRRSASASISAIKASGEVAVDGAARLRSSAAKSRFSDQRLLEARVGLSPHRGGEKHAGDEQGDQRRRQGGEKQFGLE